MLRKTLTWVMAQADCLAISHPEFLEDLQHWVEQDRRTAKGLMQLMKAVMRDPFHGIGKPEPLRHFGSGVWSRRITQEHRLVYVVKGTAARSSRADTTTHAPLKTGTKKPALKTGSDN